MVAVQSYRSTDIPLTPAASERVALLEQVSKHYGRVQALKEVNLEVQPGEVAAILGPNGAGKTTAVNLMLGLLKATSGQVRLFGSHPQNAQSRMRTGAMLQISGVPETLKVGEHLELFRSYYPHPLDLKEVVQIAGLEGLEGRTYGKLSGGQKQRLHFALALCGDPDLLFLDEPTVGLDAASRRTFWEQIRGFSAQGKTVVLTTHYLEEADALADRIIVMNEGEIIAQGTPAEIKAKAAGRRIRCVTTLSEKEVQALPGVTSVSHDGVSHDGTALDLLVKEAEPIVLELLQRDPNLKGLEVTNVGLEAAFFALTDKRTTKKEVLA